MTQLTKREQIAAMAMQALLSVNDIEKMAHIVGNFGMSTRQGVAASAVLYADDLIAELEKGEA